MIPQFSLHPNDYTSSFVLAAVRLISLPILLQWNDKTDITHENDGFRTGSSYEHS